MKRKILATLIAFAAGTGSSVSFAQADAHEHANAAAVTAMSKLPRENGVVPASMLPKTEAEWKKVLTPEQYKILRKKRTERAFTGVLYDLEAKGIYRCAACGQPLFDSSTKYDSGTGWPSFYQPVSASAISTADDSVLFWKRTEVLCSRCGGHLGHVFEDGPQPTGLRYCLNSAALTFEKRD